MRRLTIVSLLATLLAGVAVAGPAGSPGSRPAGASSAPAFGVFVNSPSDVGRYKARFDAFSNWVPRPNAPTIEMYKLHVSHTDGWGPYTSPFWLGHFDGLPIALNLAPYPNGGSSAGVLSGSYDGYYRALADRLIARGHAGAHLVLAHELNGDWFYWGAPKVGASTYVAVWRHIHGVFMSRPGARFLWNWNVSLGQQQMGDPTAAYPGDAYVDVVGMDIYDQDWKHLPAHGGDWYVKRWNHMRTMPYGLDWLAAFAAARNKPISFPEWGLTTIASRPESAGGDNPYFVQKFHEWITTHNVWWHAYHESRWTDGDHLIQGTNFPNAAAEFRRRYSTGTHTAPPPSGSYGSYTPPSAAPAPPPPVTVHGIEQPMWTVSVSGAVRAHGGAPHLGDVAAVAGRAYAVGIAATPSRQGYWIVTADGGVFAFGDATFHGSMGGYRLNAPVIGIDATPSGNGYVLLAADGGVFAFGDATFHGSTGGLPLRAPVVDFELTPTGRGYVMAAADGGVFAFGDARFEGSAAGLGLASPVVSIASAGTGYWLVGRDGGIFSFGVPFHGSLAGQVAHDVIRIRAVAGGAGYVVMTTNGTVFGLGSASGAAAGGVASLGIAVG